MINSFILFYCEKEKGAGPNKGTLEGYIWKAKSSATDPLLKILLVGHDDRMGNAFMEELLDGVI